MFTLHENTKIAVFPSKDPVQGMRHEAEGNNYTSWRVQNNDKCLCVLSKKKSHFTAPIRQLCVHSANICI